MKLFKQAINCITKGRIPLNISQLWLLIQVEKESHFHDSVFSTNTLKSFNYTLKSQLLCLLSALKADHSKEWKKKSSKGR